MNECIVCYKQAEALCQRCRTPYCSRRCQAEDWPEHKASCIPMPQLVAAKRSGSPRSRLNESVSSVQQRLKYNANDSDGKAKQQVNGSVSDRSNLVQTIKQKDEESPLRPLKHSDGKTKQQVNGSESNRSNVVQKIKQEDDESILRPLKDSDEKPKQQVNGSVSDRSNLVQTIKQEDEESPLRPPKSKLPTEIISPTDTATAISPSMFGNPFKRNSQNIGFNANVNKNRLSLPEGLLPEARPISGEHNRGILTEPTVSVPVKSSVVDVTRKEETDREENVPQVSMQSLSLNEEKKKVIETEHQQGREEIFTMKDIKIVPLTVDKKMVCLDSSNIEKGYVSLCANDGKAVALIDRMSSTIANYCNSRANDSYRPQTGELCLCLFDEDKEWYRAVVLKVMDTDSFQVSFIDYGNVSTARTKNIRKMPREFMHHCLVNTCYIEGFDDSSPEAKLRVEQFFSNNPILEVANLKQLKSGVYLIELDC